MNGNAVKDEQFLKHKLGIDVTPEGNVIFNKDEHDKKLLSPKLITEFGKVILVIFVELKKQFAGILVIVDDDKITFVKKVQFEKEFDPILLTELGNVTLLRPEALKQKTPIDVTFAEKGKAIKFVQLLKQYVPNVTTELGNVTDDNNVQPLKQ